MSKQQKKLFFLVLFSLVGFLSLQIPFNKLAGSNVSFTLFDFFGPIAGAFLGPVAGITSVLTVEVVNNLIKHTPWTTGTIIRLFPTLFAVFYFATVTKQGRGKWILAVPILAILVFLIHPIGRQVPYYAVMFWSIPLIAYKFKNNIFMKSLGATMTAHSVGGAAWIWVFNLKAQVWNGLIPIVLAERLLFATGIATSFIVVRYLLKFLASKKILPSLDIASS